MFTTNKYTLNKCCYCLELKTGCYVIGVIMTAYNFFHIVSASMSYDKIKHHAVLGIHILCSADLAMCCLGLISGFLLLIGIYKDKGIFVKLSFICFFCCIIASLILELCSVTAYYKSFKTVLLVYTTVVLGAHGFFLYFLNAVRSYYILMFVNRRPVTNLGPRIVERNEVVISNKNRHKDEEQHTETSSVSKRNNQTEKVNQVVKIASKENYITEVENETNVDKSLNNNQK